MSVVDCNKIISWSDIEGDNLKEKHRNMYIEIGKYLINNANRLSDGFTDYTRAVEINIKINPEEIILVDRKICEYLHRG
ncbi:hypothetical protein [Romboutsia lituseburensis]|uniref:hypothetical protein n=1 Tax=Romboutsia lituseburensis TaxID=1537 RepID=UPI0022EA7586|nr:hypothetical protein [Romboutsia lituseburensis]